MSRSEPSTPPIVIAVMILLVILTIVACLLMVRSVPRSTAPSAIPEAVVAQRESGAIARPIRLEIRQGDLVVERTLPAMGFAIEPGETLDPRVAPGPFTAVVSVPLDLDAAVDARVGAHIEGGDVIVRYGDDIVLSDAAAEHPIRAMSPGIVAFGGRDETLVYEFASDGSRRAALRGVWQPVGADVPRPLPVSSSRPALFAEATLRGRVLATERSCVACHRSASPALSRMLNVGSRPGLGMIGSRVRPSWLRAWLAAPHSLRDGTSMPDLAHGGGLDEDAIEDVVHYLVSLGGPIDLTPTQTHPDEIEAGKILYHRVGCVPCHGPLVSPEALPEGLPTAGEPWADYVPLGRAAARTTRSALAAFLRDPLAHRPGGQMPSLDLTSIEADQIAAYLMSIGPVADTAEDRGFRPDPARVDAGRAVFRSAGCAACHAVETNGLMLPSDLAAPSFESLVDAPDRGCLAEHVAPGVPDFRFTRTERDDLRAFVAHAVEAKSYDVPVDDLLVGIHRLRCTACHAYETAMGPEAAIRPYFVSSEEADLGDEARIPPALTDAGARLTTAWMREVLAGEERARPYLATRMPEYGRDDVGDLPAQLAAAAGATAVLDREPQSSADRAAGGRTLVGDAGLNCIQCHRIAGHESTGTPGPDLALMPGRLRYDYFDRWMREPSKLAPGTRMPTFYVNGRSAVTDVDDGRAEGQIASMWCYLAQGETLALPDGLVDTNAYELVVGDRPIVFRTFMADAGVRAIACGFPDGVHCAYDAERCSTVLAWDGTFLSAAAAWAARGGNETNPEQPGWAAPGGLAIDVVAADPSASDTMPRFRGYRLDAGGRPTFESTLIRGPIEVEVTETPAPEGPRTLSRTLTFTGPPGQRLLLRAGPGARVAGSTPDGSATMIDESVACTLGPDGRAELVLEVSW